MQTISATNAKNHLAMAMEDARRAPLVIEKNGRPYVVMMSADDYKKNARAEQKESFIALCRNLAATAKSRGMTEDVLRGILRDR